MTLTFPPSSALTIAEPLAEQIAAPVSYTHLPKFDQNGLIPALAMDHVTHEPLMLAYMNAESLRMAHLLLKESRFFIKQFPRIYFARQQYI